MSKENLKNRTKNELETALGEKRNLLRAFRFKISKGKAKDVKLGNRLKKDMARILTELKNIK
ncbi:MAG: 50S ribosomal protein L29 [Patescibacteria group bacterium]